MYTKTIKKKHFSKNLIVVGYNCPDIHIFTLQFSTTESQLIVTARSLCIMPLFGEERLGELYPAWVTNLLHPQQYCASTNCMVAWQPFCAKVPPFKGLAEETGGKCAIPVVYFCLCLLLCSVTGFFLLEVVSVMGKVKCGE